MVHFYDLPLEIRQMIYKECLVVGIVFPYSVTGTYSFVHRDHSGKE